MPVSFGMWGFKSPLAHNSDPRFVADCNPRDSFRGFARFGGVAAAWSVWALAVGLGRTGSWLPAAKSAREDRSGRCLGAPVVPAGPGDGRVSGGSRWVAGRGRQRRSLLVGVCLVGFCGRLWLRVLRAG